MANYGWLVEQPDLARHAPKHGQDSNSTYAQGQFMGQVKEDYDFFASPSI